MTPQDLLRDLRDIHLPPDPPGGFDSGIALWPVVGLALALGALAVLGLWRRGAWRRAARARLAAIDGFADRTGQWTALVELCVQVARLSDGRVVPPATVYRDPDSVGQAEIDGLKQRLLAELGR